MKVNENCNNRTNIEMLPIRMAGVKRYAIEDGVGVRTSLYSCMCPHHCKGCHNPETWDYENGYTDTLQNLYSYIMASPYNVTFSGGDPFVQWEAFYHLAKKIKENSNKTIWIYTGYTFEQIIKDDKKRLLLEQCDILIDGQFMEDLKDFRLPYCGSSNQRVIDIQKTIQANKIILYSK